MDRRGIVQPKGQVVRMFIGSVRDYSMSGVQKSSQASSAAADDVRRQLEKELNDTTDRLRRIDLVSPANPESSLGRQSGCDVLDEAEANTTRDALFASRERLLARIKRLHAAHGWRPAATASVASVERLSARRGYRRGAAIGAARLCAL